MGNLVQTYNIKETYIYEDESWLGILEAASFEIFSKENGLKCYSAVLLVFGCDMILPIRHTVDWGLLRHQNQTQIDKDNIRKNSKIVDRDYKVGDKFMLNNSAALKY